MTRKKQIDAAPTKTRCAIYTRKSSEDGLQQEFNSLDAQRESAEAYIAAQKHEGWQCLPDRYDDGGFTGGNMDRPGVTRLLTDIRAGKIDCVVVYKVDRLSRSLMDFARMMETFDKHKVSFVSVTQQFNTTHSMGRLTLNILLSFAQFEREIIGERIRDKISATRRKGKWSGGLPVLGYDVDRANGRPKLVVNAAEAAKVRKIFELYLEHNTLLSTVEDLERRGWRCKQWRSRDGREMGGSAFNRNSLYQLLVNRIYTGKVMHKGEAFDGEQEAIVTAELFNRVQKQLREHGANGQHLRNRYGALLKGLMVCKACNRAMVHTHSQRGNKRWRYYVCSHAIKSGRSKCPSGSLPAAEIERVVVEQIRGVGSDPRFLADVLAQARAGIEQEAEELRSERRGLDAEHRRLLVEVRQRTQDSPAAPSTRIVDATQRAQEIERRMSEIDARVAGLERERLDESDVKAAFADWDDVWEKMSPSEQAKLLALLVQRVEWDVKASAISVTFHPSGIKALAQGQETEAA